jgi:hypothetical protein
MNGSLGANARALSNARKVALEFSSLVDRAMASSAHAKPQLGLSDRARTKNSID